MIKKLAPLVVLIGTLFAPGVYSANSCCCTDCICPPGPTGAQGPQGQTGPQGPCCGAIQSTVVASLYSIIDQQIPSGNVVTFENTSTVTLANFDVSLAPSTGQITFLTSGTYSITWRVAGELTPPFPDPVPAWSLSLFLDGTQVPGSCFAGFSLFPDLLTSNGASNIIVVVAAGQVLTLQNTSLLPISLISSTPGSIFPQISATLSIIKE